MTGIYTNVQLSRFSKLGPQLPKQANQTQSKFPESTSVVGMTVAAIVLVTILFFVVIIVLLICKRMNLVRNKVVSDKHNCIDIASTQSQHRTAEKHNDSDNKSFDFIDVRVIRNQSPQTKNQHRNLTDIVLAFNMTRGQKHDQPEAKNKHNDHSNDTVESINIESTNGHSEATNDFHGDQMFNTIKTSGAHVESKVTKNQVSHPVNKKVQTNVKTAMAKGECLKYKKPAWIHLEHLDVAVGRTITPIYKLVDTPIIKIGHRSKERKKVKKSKRKKSKKKKIKKKSRRAWTMNLREMQE